MQDPLGTALKVSAAGIGAQSTRLRVIAENLANAQSTGRTPGADPYTRKVISFEGEIDALTGASMARPWRIDSHRTPYRVEHIPGHPAADVNGYVKLPNVNELVEMADMREANRAYEANIQAVKQVRELIAMTIDMLRST